MNRRQVFWLDRGTHQQSPKDIPGSCYTECTNSLARQPWTCPKCGRTLTVRNQEHTCGLFDLQSHFERKDPLGRIAFDWMCDLFDALGPYNVLPMKTIIAFAQTVNFAFLKTKRSGAEISIVLSRPVASPRISGSIPYSRTKTIVQVRISEESELDEELRGWLVEARMTPMP